MINKTASTITLPVAADYLAGALRDLLESGSTDDRGAFVIYPTNEELNDENEGIRTISAAQQALLEYDLARRGQRRS